jgi:HSP20 family protein
MARNQSSDDDLLLGDELTAAFLGNDPQGSDDPQQSSGNDWLSGEDENVPDLPGQLAVDVYETPDKVVVQAPIAGIDRSDLDVSLSESTVSTKGTRKSGAPTEGVNYYVQECYWGPFARSITLPVTVKEDDIDAMLKDGVLTITFTKVEQNIVKKIEIK